MAPKKLKIKFIEAKKPRQTALRKRRATLLDKARELATLCEVAVAVIVYSYGEDVPSTFPTAAGVKEIVDKHLALPDTWKSNMNIEEFLVDRIAKVRTTLDKLKAANRNSDADLVLNDIRHGRRHNLDDLAPELADAVRSSYQARMKLLDYCIRNPPSSQDAAAAEAAPPADAAAIVPDGPQELLVAPVVADEPAPLLPMELDGEPAGHESLFDDEMLQSILEDLGGSNVEHDLFKPQ
ncbi:hypothetical protein QOZ80_5BG0453830 [Eleusine coracana subsp. coracana]|nr:hypothetical protein QOZ80_5BG0453830 [Eleusine coracana subsp. coracana]